MEFKEFRTTKKNFADYEVRSVGKKYWYNKVAGKETWLDSQSGRTYPLDKFDSKIVIESNDEPDNLWVEVK